MSKQFRFSEAEKRQIDAAIAAAKATGTQTDVSGDNKPSGTGNWKELYTTLSKIFEGHLKPENEKHLKTIASDEDIQNMKNVKLWLDVAADANGGNGMHSKFIRTYTTTQGRLRLGRDFTEEEMQLASNGVAFNFVKQLKQNEPYQQKK